MRNQIAERFGDAALGRLTTGAEQNRGAAEFWGRYCAFDPVPLAFPDDIPEAIRALGQAALALLEHKDRATP
jgi:hypothetical protein